MTRERARGVGFFPFFNAETISSKEGEKKLPQQNECLPCLFKTTLAFSFSLSCHPTFLSCFSFENSGSDVVCEEG